MSESSPERTGGGNVFTRKLGPLPMWTWMALVLLVAVLYYLYKKNSSANAAASTTSTSGTTDQSLVPQFVNQTYVNGTPPAAPNANSTLGSSGNPVNTLQEGTAGSTPQGLSVTPYAGGKVDVGFGAIPGVTKYSIDIIDLANNSYVKKETVSNTHPTFSGLKPGKYKIVVSGVGQSGSVDKEFTVPAATKSAPSRPGTNKPAKPTKK